MSANVSGFGIGYLGGSFGLGDELKSIYGNITYGLSDYTDGRLKLGFSDLDQPNTKPKLLLGLDFKYQFMDYYNKKNKDPFDMAVTCLFEYVDYGGWNVLEFGGGLIASIPYRLNSGQRLIPYGRLNFRLEDIHESDFVAGLNLGVKYELSQGVNVYGEFQIDGNSGFFTGLEFRAL
ncbi:MAG: hypothetical protein NTV06_08160 [candidate division Zixibacteria bacterium]|nr:hypothetical protein [candidate division Zixibacteria bacterium]